MLSPELPRVTLGRSPQADVPLTWDDEVSRLHAAIEWMGTHWTILDAAACVRATGSESAQHC